jgi:hypothetical protein
VSDRRATGGCLCGAVRYAVSGPLRDVLVCHCADCRRWHGHVCAASACRREDLAVEEDGALRWYTPATSAGGGRRGFCARCGSSLFWDAPARATVSIAAGTLDPPTGLATAGHVYVDGAGDYYELPDDGLPRHRGSSVAAAAAP